MPRPRGSTGTAAATIPDMEVADALRAMGGTARWRELKGHVSWRALKRARRDGTVSCSLGAWSLVDAGEDRVRANQLRGVRSHTTAAAHWGLALPPRGPTTRYHVTIPRKAQRRYVATDVVLHYRDYPAADVRDVVTSPVRTVIDCLRDEPLPVALSVGDSALRLGIVDAEELEAATCSLRGPGSHRVRVRVAMLDARAANALESSCRAILLAAGITGFQPQVSIRHRRQWIGRVDLADRVRRIVVECDGFEYHGHRDAFVRDLVRHTSLTAAGWRTLRFTWEQVMFRPEWVLECVRDAIGEAPLSRTA